MDRYSNSDDTEDQDILAKLAKISAENLQNRENLQKDYLNIQKDRVRMATNPELQGPRLEEGLFAKRLPTEDQYFNEAVAPALQVGSLSSGSGAKALAERLKNLSESKPVSYSVEKFKALEQLADEIAKRPGISQLDKLKTAQKLNSYEKALKLRGLLKGE